MLHLPPLPITIEVILHDLAAKPCLAVSASRGHIVPQVERCGAVDAMRLRVRVPLVAVHFDPGPEELLRMLQHANDLTRAEKSEETPPQ